MTSNVTVSNRQRRVKVNSRWMEDTCARLFSGVMENLRKHPSPESGCLDIDNLETRGMVSVILVSDAAIRKLNDQWMGKDRPTDVLSFPLDLECPPAGMPWEFGEIVISVDRAAAQSAEYGHTFEREMAFLFVHGLLHVLGFDHMTEADEKAMFSRQRKVLECAGFPRDS